MQKQTSQQTDTIVGIATATGKAGVSIIRISGSKALASVQKVFYHSKPSQIKSNPIFTNQISIKTPSRIENL